MNVLDLLRETGIEPRYISSTKGGEYHSSCPGCGGKEHRFCVWPEQNDGAGSWWCRICDKGGDNIEFLRIYCGMDFHEACEKIGRDPGERPIHRPIAPRSRAKFHPKTLDVPGELWRIKSGELVAWAHDHLLRNKEQLAYLSGRGISLESVKLFKLGWNPGKDGKDLWRPRGTWGLPEEINPKTNKPKRVWMPRGLVIPFFWKGVLQRVRFRRTPDAMQLFGGDTKYILLPGSAMGPMLTRETGRAWIVVEAELDAMAVDGAAGDLDVGAVGLGTLSGKPDARSWSRLKDALWIGNALDFELYKPQNEEDERNLNMQTKVKKWWEKNLAQCKRWPVPEGKDPGDYVKDHGGDLREWIKAGLPPRLLIGRSAPVVSVRGEGDCSSVTSKGAGGLQLAESVEAVRTILMTNRVEVHVSESGMVIGCLGPSEVAVQIAELGLRPVVREWLSQVGEEVVTYRNFMKPLETK